MANRGTSARDFSRHPLERRQLKAGCGVTGTGYSSEVNQELEGVPAAAGAVVFWYATLTPSRALPN